MKTILLQVKIGFHDTDWFSSVQNGLQDGYLNESLTVSDIEALHPVHSQVPMTSTEREERFNRAMECIKKMKER